MDVIDWGPLRERRGAGDIDDARRGEGVLGVEALEGLNGGMSSVTVRDVVEEGFGSDKPGSIREKEAELSEDSLFGVRLAWRESTGDSW